MPKAETRRFGMHANLLYDVITKQAGTVQKAILEGAMNAIDAGATRCDIKLTGTHFSISDDGRGFADMKEITKFFETFGTPHKEGDARYGRFRMGRGQIMAFGINRWHSNGFEMLVDIKSRGLDYDLKKLPKASWRNGTLIEVELYDRILPSDLERAKAELRRFVAWSDVPVTLNGERISQAPSSGKWDYEDENAWYSFSGRQTLDIYNIGVLVTTAHAGRFGTGGVVVSKSRLDVNFARNDVQSSCKVFRKIAKVLQAHSNDEAVKKARLSDGEMESLARQFIAGDFPETVGADIRILTDVNGRGWPLSKLSKIIHSHNNTIAVAARGDTVMETAMKRGLCFVIDEETLDRFGSRSLEDFCKSVKKACKTQAARRSEYEFSAVAHVLSGVTLSDRETFEKLISSSHMPLSEKDLRKDERMFLAAVAHGATVMEGVFRKSSCLSIAGIDFDYQDRRFIEAGQSDTAMAWTDGSKTIWISRKELASLRKGYRGAFRLAMTLLHEYLHDGPDTGTHAHDQAFYEAFHDISSGCDADPVGRAAEAMLKYLSSRMRREGKALPRILMDAEDTVALLS